MSLVGTGFPQPAYHHHEFSYYHPSNHYQEPVAEQPGQSYFSQTPSSWMFNPTTNHGSQVNGLNCNPGLDIVGAGMSPDQYSLCSGTPSPDYSHQGLSPMPLHELGIHYDPVQFPIRTVKRKGTNNKKERRRTLSINSAFTHLRGCIPNVPSDTKLSKIKTLKLATSYIVYLTDVLSKDDPDMGEFKAEIKKIERKKHVDPANVEGTEAKDNSSKKGRTGWPQAVWASELK